MKTMHVAVAATLAVLTTFGVANAQSLKMRQLMADQEKQLVDSVKHLNDTCGTNIAVKFDWAGAPQDQLQSTSASSFCSAGLDGVRRVCNTPEGKDAVKQKVTSVTCGFGSERSVSLKDGTIDYKINFSSSNDADYVYDYLLNNL